MQLLATDFMTLLQSLDYSKLERFPNVGDEISIKILLSFFECDRYDFQF